MTPAQAPDRPTSRPAAATTTTAQGPATTGTADDSAPAHDTACQQAAKQLRRQHPRWVVLWIPRTGRYHAYPLYTRRSLILTAGQPAELAALMEQAEQAARRPPDTTA